MDRARQVMEANILEKYFPRRYAFVGLNGSNPYVDLGLKSNDGNVYRFKILLNSFPYNVPKVYITYPDDLKTYDGRNIVDVGASHSMHLLQPMGNMPQVCHFKSDHWHSQRTIYNVSLKLRVWMEAYESHLRTGQTLDYFVSD